MNIKRLVFFFLYYGLARHLPPSFAPGGNVFKWVRSRIAGQLFKECGQNVNVEKGASFHSGRHVRIGNNSGIGVNAEIGGEVSIGNDVMMGPNVTIWTSDHDFTRVDVPMIQQGMKTERPVTIKDDVWIAVPM